MSGNAREYLLDEWQGDYIDAPTVSDEAWSEAWSQVDDCTLVCNANEIQRVVRGGSFYDISDYLRVERRDFYPTNHRRINLGFRLHRTDN